MVDGLIVKFNVAVESHKTFPLIMSSFEEVVPFEFPIANTLPETVPKPKLALATIIGDSEAQASIEGSYLNTVFFRLPSEPPTA